MRSAALGPAIYDISGGIVAAEEGCNRASEAADGGYRIAYPDLRRRDHRHRIGVIAEAENSVASVVDRKIVNRGNVDLSRESAAAQRDRLHYSGRLPHDSGRGDGSVCGGAVRGNDDALGEAGQSYATGGGFGGIVDDGQLVVGELRTVAAEDQSQSSVGREHHHARSVTGENRGYGRTYIRLSVDDIRTRGGHAIRDEGAVFEPAARPAAGRGGVAAAQQDQTGGQQGKQQNQNSFQTWDSNLMPDNHLDASRGL